MLSRVCAYSRLIGSRLESAYENISPSLTFELCGMAST